VPGAPPIGQGPLLPAPLDKGAGVRLVLPAYPVSHRNLERQPEAPPSYRNKYACQGPCLRLDVVALHPQPPSHLPLPSRSDAPQMLQNDSALSWCPTN